MSSPRNLVILVFLGLVIAGSSAAQETGIATAGPEYKGGMFKHWFVGKDYRDLWTTPIEVEIVDLATYAGGLTPVGEGGGKQTMGLRFVSATGRPFSFRSLDKDPAAVLPEELWDTLLADLIRDQTSAAFPTGFLVCPPLMDALDILNGAPKIVILPDSPLLGEFREKFAGAVGSLEEWPNEGPDNSPGFAGATDIISTVQLFEVLQADSRERIDAVKFLTCRLLDVLIGDWDRHNGQYRWANLGDSEPASWVPIPEDRDQAFVRYTGLLPTIARAVNPQLTKFDKSYPHMLGATWNGREVDRRLLVGLEESVWDSVAVSMQARLTDRVIDDAVSRLPAAHYELRGEQLKERLKIRRDHLGEMAHDYYRHLAGQVDVNGTDSSERYEVEWLDDGGLRITVAPVGSEEGEPYYARRYNSDETGDIRLFLHGGDDIVEISGHRECGTDLRIISGDGNNRISTSASGGGVTVYDDRQVGDLETGNFRLDGRPWNPEEFGMDPEIDPYLAFQDWGVRTRNMPILASNADIGLLFGVVHSRKAYGFRSYPYGNQHIVAAAYSTKRTLGSLFYSYHNVFVNSPNSIRFTADYSGLRGLNFYGLGNNTLGEEDEREFFESNSRYLVTGVDHIWERRRNKVTTGLNYSYNEDLKEEVTFVSLDQPYGYGKFSAASLAIEYQYDSRDLPAYPKRGVFFKVGGSFTPELLDVDQGGFGEGHAQLAGFTTPVLGVTAAARVSGKKLWGTFPYFESAFVGGGRTVRGFEANRYSGDTSVYGNVELRFKTFDNYFLVPGEVGLFLLADTGRVYVDGDSPGGWHNGVGFGVWGAAIDRFSTMSLSFAWGDRFSLYYTYGFAY